jgi:hypothetical protein
LIAAIIISNAGGSGMAVNGVIEAGVLWNPIIASTYNSYAASYTALWAGTVNSGASPTIVIHDYGPVDGAVADVVEYQGTLVLDQTATAFGAETTATSTGVTGATVTPNELEIGAVGVCEGSQNSPLNNFALSDGLPYAAVGVSISLAYLQYSASSTGTASSGTTIVNGNYPSWDGVIATFTFSSSPVVTPTPTPYTYPTSTPTPYTYPTPTPYTTPYQYPTATPVVLNLAGLSLTFGDFLAIMLAAVLIFCIVIVWDHIRSKAKSKRHR